MTATLASPHPTAAGEQGPIRFLVLSASLNSESLNARLAELARRAIERRGGAVDMATMKEFDCPSYDHDVEAAGLPTGAQEFHRRIVATDAFVIASPEYNGSMPGMLKNAIDWVSRFRPQPFNARHGILLSASPSMVGGNRGLWALRVPLEHLGARVYPDMFSLAQAHQAFDDGGDLSSKVLADRFDATIAGYMELVEATKRYPCAKKAWIEFLGEKPAPVIDRVE